MANSRFKPTMTKSELRPCVIANYDCNKPYSNALFHKWIEESQVIAPSVLKGGHNGGEVRTAFAIVEYENGWIEKVHPDRVRFLDGLHKQFAFEKTEADK